MLLFADTHSSGTTPMHTVAGLGQAVSYLDSLGGADAVQRHNLSLRNAMWQELKGLAAEPELAAAGLRLLSPPPGSELASSIVSFSVARDFMDAAELAAKLKQDHAIIVKTKPHHNPEFPDGDANWINSMRLSWHVFNSQADVRTMATALRAIISGAL